MIIVIGIVVLLIVVIFFTHISEGSKRTSERPTSSSSVTHAKRTQYENTEVLEIRKERINAVKNAQFNLPDDQTLMSEDEFERIMAEVKEDLPYTKSHEITTLDRTVSFFVKNTEVVWAKKKDGKKYKSIEELLDNERVGQSAYNDLMDYQRRINNVRKAAQGLLKVELTESRSKTKPSSPTADEKTKVEIPRVVHSTLFEREAQYFHTSNEARSPVLTGKFQDDCDEMYEYVDAIKLAQTDYKEESESLVLTIEFVYKGKDMMCCVNYKPANKSFDLINDLIAYIDEEGNPIIYDQFNDNYEKEILVIVVTNIVERDYSLSGYSFTSNIAEQGTT